MVLSSFLPPSVGGAENVAAAGINALRGRGHDVTVVTGPGVAPRTTTGSIPKAGQPSLVRIQGLHPVADDAQGAEQVETELGELLSAYEYDVMYTHLLTYPWAPRRSSVIIRVARAHSLPIVAAEHLDAPRRSPVVCSDLMSAVDTVVCCSRYVRGRLRQLVKTTHPTSAPPPFEVLHPRVVSSSIFSPDRQGRSTMCRELRLRSTDFVVFFPSRFFDADGSFSAHKGPLVALKAFANFARVVHDAKLLGICPRGFFGKTEGRKARDRVRSIVHSLGIEQQTLIINRAMVPLDMARCYRAADVVLIPSVEGFGLVYLEAMGCGVPVVGIAQGASLEVIGADAGILVAHGDRLQDRLTSALIRLYEDPYLRERLATAAHKRFQSQFTDEGYGLELETLLARWAK